MPEIKNIYKNLFSIENYNETHFIMNLFGLKIKFPKYEYARKKKENPFYYYKKNNIDITTLPHAVGQIRDIQLANLALLKELDYVCKENWLTYWLDGGTLLGAIRHKGFIPWDDDIDTAMLREDYEKVINAFKKSSRNPDIFADYVRDKNNNYIIKIRHKKCPRLFVDIFPWDSYGECLTLNEQIKKTKELKDIRQYFKNSQTDNQTLKKQLHETMSEKVLSKSSKEKSDYVWGIDFNHPWKNWFTKYDVLHPLNKIIFEGEEFPCLNNPDAFLKRLYGDYMSYPKKIGVGHSMFLQLTDEEKEIIEELKSSLKSEVL